jgi:hypothetical protein
MAVVPYLYIRFPPTAAPRMHSFARSADDVRIFGILSRRVH